MSIAILVAVHDGLVIAADSASTLNISTAPGVLVGAANVYDNANKIFNLYKGKPIGCVTFGSGNIGTSSIGTLIKDLRAILMDPSKRKEKQIEFNPENYTMEHVANIISTFLHDACSAQPDAVKSNINIGILVGGYSTNGSLGESWGIEIKPNDVKPPQRLRNPEEPGINWGGASEVVQRIVIGYSPALFHSLAAVTGGEGQPQRSAQDLFNQLNPLLLAKLQAPLVFAPMPIQDAIDLARFLVYAAEMYSRFIPGPQIVGGPIEIAAITKHEHFKWISRKHYYNQSLNVEPKHVVIDYD